MAPMKLYGATVSWNVTRCVVALEEAGAEYQIVPIDFATAEHKSPDILCFDLCSRSVKFQLSKMAISTYGIRTYDPIISLGRRVGDPIYTTSL